jgi:hypothetical protein
VIYDPATRQRVTIEGRYRTQLLGPVNLPGDHDGFERKRIHRIRIKYVETDPRGYPLNSERDCTVDDLKADNGIREILIAALASPIIP